MGQQTRVQSGKHKDLYAGFGISKDELKKSVAVAHVIDCNKRPVGNGKVNNTEPKFTK